MMEPVNGTNAVKSVADSGWTESQREPILLELNRLLADPSFNRSHRCVVLLRSMVRHALEGDQSIKERTLGVEVFDRNASYDTNSDPIVRMTANEIRKRLAQYYQNADHKRDVIIHIESGSYIPNFKFIVGVQADKEKSLGSSAGQHSDEQVAEKVGKSAVRSLFWGKRTVWLVLVVIIAAAAAFRMEGHWLRPSSQYLVWKPMLEASEPLVICVATNPALQSGQAKTAEEQAAQTQIFADMAELRKLPEIPDLTKFHPTTPFEDALRAQIVTRWFGLHGRETTLVQASSLAFRDFKRERVVMIGGFDNPWSVILLTGLRYSLRADPATGTFWIRDAQNLGNRNWATSDKADSSDVDYGLIASFYDGELENRIMVIGGLGKYGTGAAARLLLDPSLDGNIPASVRSANNFEIVIKTYQVNGEATPPQIVATYTW